ncbi:hypothetical protein STCU_07613 [Strigomonas culicis]|uniref:Uncharacterized protein n=1 Tax=Strigomonas culicis TaxID=28005 RepID=S9TYP9_9TRYP|nr:hypothetical protein STCU_07613 [Strigomonas culicis]|eukprot:EPY23627.1 hypothetical protein STCU_07613 [Strigomonas culicis]
MAGVNPLQADAALREEVMGLNLWRASLLVCLRRDPPAVHSPLNLADALTQEHRRKPYCAAATWAALNDMEVIYYRSVLKQYQHFPLSESFATGRDLLLAKVFEAVRHDDYYTQYCTHVVFSKEVTATVSRAQAAQVNGDVSEDPMRSLCLVLSIPYYRFRISDAFWKHFFNLLCMPPIPPPTESEREQDPATLMGLTPNHVLDAVGRSILLHHLVLFADTRRKEIDSGIVADRVELFKAKGMQPHRSDYDQVLTDQEFSIAMARMRQLLVVVKSHEEQAGRLAGEAGAASKLEGGRRPAAGGAQAQ